MADENEINKEESANSLTRDSSNQVGEINILYLIGGRKSMR